MIRWFAWLTTVNVVGVIVLALAVLAPGVLAYFLLLPRASIEMKLVPVENAPARSAPPAVLQPSDAASRLEVPAALRSPDLSSRPWDELPGGAVRLRD